MFVNGKARLCTGNNLCESADEAAAPVPLAKALGVTIRRRKNLNAIRMLKEAMMEQLMYGGGGGRRRK